MNKMGSSISILHNPYGICISTNQCMDPAGFISINELQYMDPAGTKYISLSSIC